MSEGAAILLPAEGETFDPTEIPAAVEDAGFKPGPVSLTATGTLQKGKEFLRLKMPGRVKQFVLAKGAKAEALGKDSDLLGKKVQVQGRLHPHHADRPPGLTVEQYSARPSP